jgi:ABC-2 type transport system permease protein
VALTDSAVSVRELTKRFGKRVAVDRLSFEVPVGVVAGFIGPNGAGKSTTPPMLVGLVRPSSGSACVLGHDVADPASYIHRVGALIEAPAFYRFGVITTLANFLSAQPAASSAPGRGTTLEALGAAGGATEAFRVGTGFLGVLVVVVFAARMATEFSHGTLRTLLVHEPRRWRVVTGKTPALFVFGAVMFAVAAALSVLLSLALAPGQDVSTTHWFGVDGVLAAGGDYLSAIGGLLGWGTFGTLLAVVFRSVPIVVAIGVAWAGPFEHLLSEAWTSAFRLLPGLQFEALAAGGNVDVSYLYALALGALHGALAVAAGLTSVSRHDIPT